ncbi:MAG TPA: imidazole glycerol phosphate synthase subunit HisH [Nitrospirales bacterium]|nr:imidazole glycerol phosphate synthase subunit HisH [Nitrospirales bacterium]
MSQATVAIIDYEMGNLRSVQKAFEAIGCSATVTRSPQVIDDASHVVLPGVGAFGDCMRNLERFGLISSVRKTIEKGKPFLGICLGLQLLFTESEEFGAHHGLDILSGRVVRFRSTDAAMKIPHMGWNQITFASPMPILKGIPGGSYLYFVHSFYVEPDDQSIIGTRTDYGTSFASGIWKDNLFACQFHPEKSQRWGMRILKNFSLFT